MTENNMIRVKFRENPTPETKIAWLPCERCRRTRLHNFKDSNEEQTAAVTTRWFTLWYECDKCQTKRIWGTVTEKLR